MTEQLFSIIGMHCVSCAMTIECALEGVDGVDEAAVSYAKNRLRVRYDERATSVAVLQEAVNEYGYDLAPMSN